MFAGGKGARFSSLGLLWRSARMVNAFISGTIATPAMIGLPGHAERLARELPLGELVTVTELARRAVFVLGDAIRIWSARS